MIVLQGDCITSGKFLEIPPAIEKALSSLAYQKGSVRDYYGESLYNTLDIILMMMGQANTGKSTLARYTVNTLLNQ